MATPRDPRVNRYLRLQSQRATHPQRLAAQVLVRSMRQHDWLSTRSLIPIPRKLLTADQKATLREAFDLMDVSGDGHIDYSELTTTMKSLGFSSDDIHAAIAAGDHDSDGTLDFDEVAVRLSNLRTAPNDFRWLQSYSSSRRLPPLLTAWNT